MSQYPSPDKLKDFVTWDSLEKALRGLQDELDRMKLESEKVVVEVATDVSWLSFCNFHKKGLLYTCMYQAIPRGENMLPIVSYELSSNSFLV